VHETIQVQGALQRGKVRALSTWRSRINVAAYEEDRPLRWVLRDSLGLLGTMDGFGLGRCGACAVHLNGTAARSCTLAGEPWEPVLIEQARLSGG
jgi:hypothetical protein